MTIMYGGMDVRKWQMKMCEPVRPGSAGDRRSESASTSSRPLLGPISSLDLRTRSTHVESHQIFRLFLLNHRFSGAFS